MHYDHFQQKRKDKKKFLRLKIITNRDFNFITAVRSDSTVTDLANRALNAYLQLSQQYRSKKQLTVSAVKQGRYFMPKSEIVSNLLSQDEEVEIIIVKAKPKFPEQQIPAQDDFQVLKKKIRNFDESISRKPSSMISKLNIQVQKMDFEYNKIHSLSKSSLWSSENSDGSNTPSKSSQLQHSKRERKNKKRQQKKLRHAQNSAKVQGMAPQPKQKQITVQKLQDQPQIQNKASVTVPVLTDVSIQFMPREIQLSAEKPNLQKLSLMVSRSCDKSIQKSQKQNGSKNLLQLPESVKRDLSLTIRSQPSQEKIEQPKKKLKVDHTIKFPLEQVSRKGSIDARSQRTPKINPIHSPKVVFHFQSKHESPKVIYIPESKTISEMKENIEKEREKIKGMSPMMLPKNSPKISSLQEPMDRNTQSLKSLLNSLMKKGKQEGAERKSSVNCQQQINQVLKDKQTQKVNRQSSTNLPIEQRRPAVMQPQIIEEQSSEEDKISSFKKLPNQMNSKQNRSNQRVNTSHTHSAQSSDSTMKKKTNASNRFYQIQTLINKFKLEQSDEEND